MLRLAFDLALNWHIFLDKIATLMFLPTLLILFMIFILEKLEHVVNLILLISSQFKLCLLNCMFEGRANVSTFHESFI